MQNQWGQSPRRTFIIGMLCSLFAIGHGNAWAGPAAITTPEQQGVELKQTDMDIREKLQRRIGELAYDDKATKELIAEGKRRTLLCKVCHGEAGISPKPEIPNLAGQNPVYIVDQFQRFADGRRNDLAMSDLGKGFSEEDKIKLALYYSRLPALPSGGGSMEERKRGEAIYNKVCAECHGADGRGEKGYARLAGQQSLYVVNMLKEFRNRTGRRANPWMTAVTLHMSPQDMQDVAYYIANMK